MDVPAPETKEQPTGHFSTEQYFRLVDEGVLEPEDRVELLDGVVVSMAPQESVHASVVGRLTQLLIERLAGRAAVRCQLPLVAGSRSVPEPDVAVVPGTHEDYRDAHPMGALLVVEVADSSLEQDRLTKTAIYAAAGVSEYWIVNLADQQVEVLRDPDPPARRYRIVTLGRRGERLTLVAFPDTSIGVDELLPVLVDH